SLLQAQIAMLDFQAARWLVNKEVPGQAGNDHPTSIPTGVFPTRDGHINIAASGQHIWKRFCAAMDAQAVFDNPKYKSDGDRSKNRKQLNADIAEYSRKYTSTELIARLNQASVPCGPIYNIDQVFADPQVKHVGAAAPLRHPTKGDVGVVDQAVRLSRTPSIIDRPTPERGEHTDTILRGLGYDDGKIADLRKRQVV
ncbi:MAG TPA: CoA transferase, partial [Vineibacter sp.]|nr:CoA transferase [Vineibacter sp.]